MRAFEHHALNYGGGYICACILESRVRSILADEDDAVSVVKKLFLRRNGVRFESLQLLFQWMGEAMPEQLFKAANFCNGFSRISFCSTMITQHTPFLKLHYCETQRRDFIVDGHTLPLQPFGRAQQLLDDIIMTECSRCMTDLVSKAWDYRENHDLPKLGPHYASLAVPLWRRISLGFIGRSNDCTHLIISYDSIVLWQPLKDRAMSFFK